MTTIKRFSEYLYDSSKEVTVGWGQMNPPTSLHESYLDGVSRVASSHPYRIYVTQTQESNRAPLEYTSKVKFIRKMFPKHARSIMHDKGILTPFDLLTSLYNEGFTKINFAVSEDRVPEYKSMLGKWNGKKGKHGFYNFESGINVIPVLKEDPDFSTSRESPTNLRESVANNDFRAFSSGIPKTFVDAKTLFNSIRLGMGLKESKDFRTHIQLEKVSDVREKYVSGELFPIGSEVLIPETNEICKVKFRGSNYIIVERIDGSQSRRWIDSIQQIQEK